MTSNQLDTAEATNDTMTSKLFRLLKTADMATADSLAGGPASAAGVRLGVLSLPGRRPVATPSFFAVTSRGALPHVTPDNVSRYGLFNGAYLGLEDFVESVPLQPNRKPPIYGTPLAASSSPAASSSTTASPHISRLHSFTALPSSAVSVLAPRRHPAGASHLGNGPEQISIVTSTGFQRLTVSEYAAAVDTLQPDIAVPMADLTFGGDAGKSAARPTAVSVPYPSSKRAIRMAERTEEWIDQWYYSDDLTSAETLKTTHIFAPTLPLPYATQWQYLNRLAELAEAQVGEDGEAGQPAMVEGLAVYDVDLLPDLDADYADTLAPLPRMSLHPAPTPHHMLRQIDLGVDVLLLPFITAASERGLAFVFKWPGRTSETEPQEAGSLLPLAIDLADLNYSASLEALEPGCTCPACAHGHHRAYIHHLLDAREMLAWTLLQVHNHYVVERFLEGIRATLSEEGREAFNEMRRRFTMRYEPELPTGKATRPRTRGYQIPKNGDPDAEPPRKLNKPAWGRLEEVPGAGPPGQDAPMTGSEQ